MILLANAHRKSHIAPHSLQRAILTRRHSDGAPHPLQRAIPMAPHRLIAILLASFVLLLMGTVWYSTAKPGATPVEARTSVAPDLPAVEPHVGHAPLAAGAESLSLVDPASTFSPFLNVVPSQDGRELYVSVGRVGELSGTVFANIGIGPGHDRGGYTMPYSETIRAYAATVVGFTPEMNDYASIRITTTRGLDSGSVDFNRDYVPPPETWDKKTRDICSSDGNLKLTLMSTDTFAVEAYVVAVPSYAPPGPLPLGHQLVGTSYSVRASGARLWVDRPMSLQLAYNETILSGADPHTLAILAWDASGQSWNNLEGTLSYEPNRPNDLERNYVSVATRRFTTYALMGTTTWRDDFSDYWGLSARNDVAIRHTDGAFELVLDGGQTSGWAISDPITPTTPFETWHGLVFTATLPSPTTTLTIDLLALDNTPVLTDVASGIDLSSLDAASYPALKLRASLSSTVAGETPALDTWRLTWKVEEYRAYLPLVLHTG